MMIVTTHAKRRLRQRLGLKSKACIRHAIKAFYDGFLARDYPHKPTAKFYNSKQEKDHSKCFIIFRNEIYIFTYDYKKELPILVTTYPMGICDV